jgi:hypothetical protein
VLLKIYAILFLLTLGGLARAAEFYEPFQSVRQLGMGGVYVFNENDANGFLQNPAYTCFAEGLNWSIFDIHLGAGDAKAYNDLVGPTGSLPQPTGFADIGPFYGKSLRADGTGSMSFVLPCFGIAGYYTGVLGFQMHNPAYPELRSFYLTDNGLQIGGGISISSVLSLGIAVKRVDRRGGPHNFSADALTSLTGADSVKTLISSIQDSGTGYGLDVGMASRLSQLPFNPTMSVAWKDLGSMSFLKTKGENAPEREKDNLVLGMTFDGHIPFLGVAGGVEYRHITDNNEQLGKKLHLGGEISLGLLDLRAGFSQGYTTYGLGMDFWLIQFDAAYYKIEKGAYAGQTPEERVQIGFLMDLSFDPSFKFLDAGGRNRRLKQRR